MRSKSYGPAEVGPGRLPSVNKQQLCESFGGFSHSSRNFYVVVDSLTGKEAVVSTEDVLHPSTLRGQQGLPFRR